MEKIEWQAPEYIHSEKSRDRYWIVGIVSVSIAIIAIILNDVIFGLLILVSAFTLSLFASRPAQIVKHELNDIGVWKGEAKHTYKEIKSFWIETVDSYPRILFKIDHRFSPFFVFLIHPDDAEEMRAFLSVRIPEEKMTESVFEKLLIYFGF